MIVIDVMIEMVVCDYTMFQVGVDPLVRQRVWEHILEVAAIWINLNLSL